jgi:hypothetical protein
MAQWCVASLSQKGSRFKPIGMYVCIYVCVCVCVYRGESLVGPFASELDLRVPMACQVGWVGVGSSAVVFHPITTKGKKNQPTKVCCPLAYGDRSIAAGGGDCVVCELRYNHAFHMLDIGVILLSFLLFSGNFWLFNYPPPPPPLLRWSKVKFILSFFFNRLMPMLKILAKSLTRWC